MRRLMITNLLAFILPMFLLFGTLFVLMIDNTSQDNKKLRIFALEQQNAVFDRLSTELASMTTTIYLNRQLNAVLSKQQYQDDYDLIAATQQCEEAITVARNLYSIKDYQISIYSVNGLKAFTGPYADRTSYYSLEDMQDEEWYWQMLLSAGNLIYLSSHMSETLRNAHPDVEIFAVRKLINLNSGRYIGVMVVDIKGSTILKDLSPPSEIEQLQYIVMDAHGTIILSTDNKRIGENWSDTYKKNIQCKGASGIFTDTIDGKAVEVAFVTNQFNDWILLSYRENRYTWPEYTVFLLLALSVCFLLALVMSRHNATFVRRKTDRIIRIIEEVSGGNLHARITSFDEDEFAELCRRYNDMLDRIERLLEKIEAEEHEKSLLEIETLRAQINPHFLYNTIASIRYIIQTGQYEHADKAMVLLVKLLRHTFGEKRDIIPLKTELTLLEQYVNIMKIRYQDSFNFTIKAQEDVLHYGIPIQTLQPFVENSISHGFNQKEGPGHIVVHVSSQENDLVILIQDDGVNADLAKIERILSFDINTQKQEQFNGIGLQTIQKRLIRRFGGAYGVSVQKNPVDGISFHIRIPKTEVEEG